MILDLNIEEALALEKPVFIDLRSPVEYREATIPHAVNVPLFNDEERAEVGTLYRQQGPQAARKKGLTFVSSHLSEMVEAIESRSTGGVPVIFCWRGGERSQAVAAVLSLLRIKGYRIRGGYKAYRKYVLTKLAEQPRGKVVVIHGLTGTGKTAIIRTLRDLGKPAVDLEGLANHRGSVFGGVGLGEQTSQKQFDACLLTEFESFVQEKYIIVESESKRIGNVYLPDRLHAQMRDAVHVLVYDTLAGRVIRLLNEYTETSGDLHRQLLQSIQSLTPQLGKKRTHEMAELLEQNQLNELIEALLVGYYDPLYGYSSEPDARYHLSIDGADSQAAATRIAQWLDQVF